jgi:ISXO2-like transposase domain/Transposase zinc-ribbon domain
MLIGILDKHLVSTMDTTFPTSLPELQRVFPDDAACSRYLEAIRWPDGFTCPSCGFIGEPYRFSTRSSVVLRCRSCKKNTSLTAGTVMQSSHMPLSTWFWGAYLMTTQTPGQSAVQFQRQLGIAAYETAFTMLHKLRAGMVHPNRDTIGASHPVEVDECYIGGRTRGEGKGVHHQTTVIGAVEIRTRKDAEDRSAKWMDAHKRGVPVKKLTYAGRLRLRVISSKETSLSGRDSDTLTTFVKDNVTPGSVVCTDAWRGYSGLGELGYRHDALALGGDPEKAEKHLPMIHLVFSNLKTWINGTHHGRIEPHHLQAYLNEFVFHFNRRFYPMNSFNSVLGISARTVPPTYAQLYSGEWIHAA